MATHAKRWMFLIHRWLGVAVCLFFAMWFVSGVVMVYVGYPKLTHAERLAHLPALDANGGLLGPAQALQAGHVQEPLQDLRLAVASGGRPVYIAVPQAAHAGGSHGAAQAVVVDARTGERLQSFGAAWAEASATAFAGPGVAVRYLDAVDEDAFTHTKSLELHRPLHRLQVHDDAGTRLYVSSSTGEVVRDAPRVERVWNYAGAWMHWLYMFRGGALDAHWAEIVNWLSIACTAVAITGTVVGIWRWRFTRPYRSGARTPYPSRMMRWHHTTGLLFAAITLSWIFSGLMSMNPWKVFDRGAQPLRIEAMHGGALAVDARDAAPERLLQAAGQDVRELRWTRVLGQMRVLAQGASGRPRLLDAQTASPRAVDEAALRTAAAALLPAPVQRIERLEHYDLHYYARADHTMTGGTDKPLPMLRVVFGDAHANPALRVQVGERSSKGVESQLSLAVTRQLQLDANVALLKARYEDFTESVGGVAVSRSGNVPTDVPQRVANLWLSWKLLPDWTLSGGLRYVGKRYADNANTLELPAYTTADLALQWRAAPATTLTLRGVNVSDKLYYPTAYYTTTQWLVGEGRRVELSLNHRF